MVTSTRSQVSKDREKWNKIFDGLVKLLKNQQQQLETLFKDRKLLEDRVKMQHDKWVSDLRLYEDHISQMKLDLKEKDMMIALKAAKFDLELGFKQRDAALHKLKLEHTEDELADFRTWFDYLSSNRKGNNSEIESGNGRSRRSGSAASDSKSKQAETKRMQLQNLVSEKDSEINTLIQEKKFVWHQYSILEKDLTSKLKCKEAEVDKANEKITKVLAREERLQISCDEKNETIRRLESKVAELEAETSERKQEMSKLSRELELLRKSQTVQSTPLLQVCNSKTKASGLEVEHNRTLRSPSVAKRCLSPYKSIASQNGSAKGSRRSKRKADEVQTKPEIPKLFSSSFKVPKVKTPSSNSR